MSHFEGVELMELLAGHGECMAEVRIFAAGRGNDDHENPVRVASRS